MKWITEILGVINIKTFTRGLDYLYCTIMRVI